jgi:hypothetical protein
MEIQSISLEARVGIEPTHKGFADLSLTTWVPRLSSNIISKFASGRQRRSSPYCNLLRQTARQRRSLI